jgi:hypothetical protein
MASHFGWPRSHGGLGESKKNAPTAANFALLKVFFLKRDNSGTFHEVANATHRMAAERDSAGSRCNHGDDCSCHLSTSWPEQEAMGCGLARLRDRRRRRGRPGNQLALEFAVPWGWKVSSSID